MEPTKVEFRPSLRSLPFPCCASPPFTFPAPSMAVLPLLGSVDVSSEQSKNAAHSPTAGPANWRSSFGLSLILPHLPVAWVPRPSACSGRWMHSPSLVVLSSASPHCHLIRSPPTAHHCRPKEGHWVWLSTSSRRPLGLEWPFLLVCPVPQLSQHTGRSHLGPVPHLHLAPRLAGDICCADRGCSPAKQSTANRRFLWASR